MYNAIKKTLPVIAFIISFAAVKYGMEYYSQSNRGEVINNEIDNTLQSLEEKVKSDRSDRTETEKVLDASQALVNKKLNDAKTSGGSKKEISFASGVFAGQYLRMTRVMFDYCKTLKVDLTPFVSKYKNIHKDMYKYTRKILEESGSSYEEISMHTNDKVLSYVKKEINDISILLTQQLNRQFTLADSCAYYNAVAKDDVAMNDVVFSSVMPSAYKVLVKNM